MHITSLHWVSNSFGPVGEHTVSLEASREMFVFQSDSHILLRNFLKVFYSYSQSVLSRCV